MILPTTYLGAKSWFEDYMREPATIEVNETFEKQTFRNRCLIRDTHGQLIRLSVPVVKAEHKQFTRDIRISYQQRWQHQHWMALVSAYEHTPYFMYFADYLQPFYEQEITYLVDLNMGLTEVIVDLLHHRKPDPSVGFPRRATVTEDWQGITWTDSHPWQQEVSVLDELFEVRM